MPEQFIAIDVETANPDLASICQIGAVTIVGGQITDSWQTLVNPEDYFDGLNVSIHGIQETDVAQALTFPQVASHLKDLLRGEVVASHTPFDRVALNRVCDKYNLPQIECVWLDTARVCRRAWPQFAQKGYGLGNMATWCEIEFQHHNAEEDARVAGLILLRAIEHTGVSLEEWLNRVKQPIGSHGSSRFTREGKPDGPLFGEWLVFTGTLCMPRREAADLAAASGCNVQNSPRENTTLLVVGDQDLRKLRGYKKSSKHRKAEQLIASGQSIRVIGESDFLALVEGG